MSVNRSLMGMFLAENYVTVEGKNAKRYKVNCRELNVKLILKEKGIVSPWLLVPQDAL